LKEMAEEQGIDLDSLGMEENEMPQKQIDEETIVHILSYM